MSAAAGALILLGALLAFAGSLGLVRLKTFYERVHPPTMGTTLGTGLILIGSMLHFSALEGRPVLHEILIGVFMTLNTPVTYMLLVRAALHAAEGRLQQPEDPSPRQRERGSQQHMSERRALVKDEPHREQRERERRIGQPALHGARRTSWI